ncbi:predicted protein [Histoplasma mississippiense (nom. inval.)]|uniref:predicted protein n=1 Tax=Ajellomyces capsulatus (strain NAm1 / WU24) TaxID=2059318 RepID=UPI000157D4B6|nr:predicted protein [Histoplasma mississippiense (nom. inval.)]EDN05089.1 predicted protein [Histoplasma mississippiense (nom. inval.)]
MGEPTRDEPTRSLRSNTLLSDEPTAQKLFNTIRKSILDTNHSIDLTFQNIAPTSGSLIVASLAEDPDIERSLPRLSYNSVTRVLTARIMPTHVHDCHQEWLCFELGQMRMAGFLSPAEARLIKFRVGTSGRPHVQLVFLIKWAKLSGGRIKGDIEIHGRDMSGNAILLQTEPIFPIPSGNPRQVIQITRAQVFGTAILTGRNPSDTYLLQVEELRQKGQDAIRQMGFVPA